MARPDQMIVSVRSMEATSTLPAIPKSDMAEAQRSDPELNIICRFWQSETPPTKTQLAREPRASCKERFEILGTPR